MSWGPVRRRILELLADGEQTSGAIAAIIRAEFGITQPAVSQHLRVLRDTGSPRPGPGHPPPVRGGPRAPREADQWLERFRGVWSQPLDALATELARGKRERRPQRRGTAATSTPVTATQQTRRGGPVIDITGQINAIHREVERYPPTDRRAGRRPAPTHL